MSPPRGRPTGRHARRYLRHIRRCTRSRRRRAARRHLARYLPTAHALMPSAAAAADAMAFHVAGLLAAAHAAALLMLINQKARSSIPYTPSPRRHHWWRLVSLSRYLTWRALHARRATRAQLEIFRACFPSLISCRFRRRSRLRAAAGRGSTIRPGCAATFIARETCRAARVRARGAG